MFTLTLMIYATCLRLQTGHVLGLYIHVVDDKFVIGINHNVDDFNLEVINYPFAQSNINSMLGYTAFYWQIIRFFRLCNNINDFLFGQNLAIPSWPNVATCIASCLNILKDSASPTT